MTYSVLSSTNISDIDECYLQQEIIISLLLEGLYKVDPGRRIIATTYGALINTRNEDRLAAAATSGSGEATVYTGCNPFYKSHISYHNSDFYKTCLVNSDTLIYLHNITIKMKI